MNLTVTRRDSKLHPCAVTSKSSDKCNSFTKARLVHNIGSPGQQTNKVFPLHPDATNNYPHNERKTLYSVLLGGSYSVLLGGGFPNAASKDFLTRGLYSSQPPNKMCPIKYIDLKNRHHLQHKTFLDCLQKLGLLKWNSKRDLNEWEHFYLLK